MDGWDLFLIKMALKYENAHLKKFWVYTFELNLFNLTKQPKYPIIYIEEQF